MGACPKERRLCMYCVSCQMRLACVLLWIGSLKPRILKGAQQRARKAPTRIQTASAHRCRLRIFFGNFIFVKGLHLMLLRQRVPKARQLAELSHSLLIKLIHAVERPCSEYLLMVGQQESPELGALEKVFPLVGSFWQRQYVSVLIGGVLARLGKLEKKFLLGLLVAFLVTFALANNALNY